MLTAIRDFVVDSFSREREAGGLRRFSVGELTVMVEQGPRAVLAAVVRGQAPDTLLERLQDTLETVHLQFAGALADFDGDGAAFEPARPLLEECLATVVATDRTRQRRGTTAWLPWAIAGLLIVAVLGGLAIRSSRRWARAVSALESQPGIVLTRAERGGGRWRFAGLRDPLARDPAASWPMWSGTPRASSSAGSPTSRSSRRWCWPGRVGASAPPASVALALAGDTLRLRGSAASRGSSPPGGPRSRPAWRRWT